MGFADIGALNYGVSDTPALGQADAGGHVFEPAVRGLGGVRTLAGQPDDGAATRTEAGIPEMQYWCNARSERKDRRRHAERGRLCHRHGGQVAPGQRAIPVSIRGSAAFRMPPCCARLRTGTGLSDDNGTIEEHDGRYGADMLTQKALGFIQEHQHEPFYLYVAYFEPHTTPLEAPEKDVGLFPRKGTEREPEQTVRHDSRDGPGALAGSSMSWISSDSLTIRWSSSPVTTGRSSPPPGRTEPA